MSRESDALQFILAMLEADAVLIARKSANEEFVMDISGERLVVEIDLKKFKKESGLNKIKVVENG